MLRLIILLGLLLDPFGFGCAVPAPSDAAVFDALITLDFIAADLQPKTGYQFSKTAADGERRYGLDYQFHRNNPAEHYAIGIAVAPTGRFIDPAADTPPDPKTPTIGRRSKQEFLGAGPGGATYGLSFTTNDAKFDIRITVSNLMPEGVEEPRFDLEHFATRLSDQYDKQSSSLP